jgi:hypothetical protein
VGVGVSWGVAAVSIQQALIRSLGGEELPPPPILGLVLTSGLYPVIDGPETLDLGASLQSINTYTFFDINVETVALATSLASAPVLTTTVSYTTYSNWPVEPIDLAASMPSAPVLTVTISYTNYANWPVEPVDLAASIQGNITLTVVIQYLNYTNWPVEPIDLAASLQGVTLA